MKENAAQGQGSEPWLRKTKTLIDQKGIEVVPLNDRAHIFQEEVNILADQKRDEGNNHLGFDIRGIGSSLATIHTNSDEKRIEYEKDCISVRLMDGKWTDGHYRSSLRRVKDLEKKYFGRSCGWLSLGNVLKSIF